MPPKMNTWTNEAEQLLIDLVEERPILWDITQSNYRRNDLKEIQWEKISRRMGALYTVEHVKKRWNNIRGTFLDNDRKMRESKRSGSSFDQIFKPKWHLYSRLQFLKKTISSAQSISNFPSYVPIAQHLLSQSQRGEDFSETHQTPYGTNESVSSHQTLYDTSESVMAEAKKGCCCTNEI